MDTDINEMPVADLQQIVVDGRKDNIEVLEKIYNKAYQAALKRLENIKIEIPEDVLDIEVPNSVMSLPDVKHILQEDVEICEELKKQIHIMMTLQRKKKCPISNKVDLL